MMADLINFDAVHAALKSTKLLRAGVRDLFRTLAEGPLPSAVRECDDGDDTALDRVMVTEVQSVVTGINQRIRELESACTLIAPPGGSSTNTILGNSGLVGQDPVWERTPLYSSLVSAYRWSDRMHEHASHVVQILNANMLKRSAHQVTAIGPIRTRAHSTHPFRRPVYTPAQVDSFCQQLQRMLIGTDIHMEVLRPFGAPAVLKVTLDRVLQSVIVLRGPCIEWVLVKGFNEDFLNENGKLDIWTPSRYQVFQKITDHANAAMLHFVHYVHPDLAVKSYVVSVAPDS
jgi:mediator of RNA polymerase II transcription subunit 27